MAIPNGEAGPSRSSSSTPNHTPTKKRVADFADSSDAEELIDIPNGHGSSTPISSLKANGVSHTGKANGKKRKLLNGIHGKEDTDEERKKRKAEAERLSFTRQDLPFYQGTSTSLCKEILKFRPANDPGGDYGPRHHHRALP